MAQTPLQNFIEMVKETLGTNAVNSVVGIDVGSSAIKLVQLKKERGVIRLETYGEIALGPYEEKAPGQVVHLEKEALKKALQDLITDANVTSEHAAFSMQSSASLIFVLSLPYVEDRHLATVIPTEARKYIPVPISEVVLDWWVIPKNQFGVPVDNPAEPQEETMEVLVAAIRNDRINAYKAIVEEVKIQSDFFEIEVFSTIRSTFHQELSPVLLVDFGASSTRLAIVEYGVVKKFHTITRGAASLTDALAKSLQIPFAQAEEIKKRVGLKTVQEADRPASEVLRTNVNYILTEIQNMMLEFEKAYDKAIGKVILAGGGSRLIGLQDVLQAEITVDVEFGDPFSKTESPEFLEHILHDAGPEFSVAVGLALKNIQ